MRVLEVGHIVAGPTAGLILSDLGFEVIKIERPGKGDIARHLTGSSSGAFPYYNRGKKSISLDISKQKGKEIFMQLCKNSDVIIDNLASGSMERLGLSYENIKNINPGIIYLSIKGYAAGPYESRKSLDYPVEIHSGAAYMNGLKGRPMRYGASIVDMSSAMIGIIHVLMALNEREKTRTGKYIDVGLFETSIFMLGQHIATYQLNDRPLSPINEEGFAWGIYDFFETSDREKIFIAVTTDDQWAQFCSSFVPDLCSVDDYRTNEGRFNNRPTLIPAISDVISGMALSEVRNILERENISYAELKRPWDMINDPHMGPKMPNVGYIGKNLKVPSFPDTECEDKMAPELGADTFDILLNEGYSENDIRDLKNNKII